MRESDSEVPKINPQSASRSEPCDEPLFVLKYRRREAIPRLIMYFAVFLLLGYYLFDRHLFLRMISLLGLLCIFPTFIDNLLFREVRLYKDRIVRVWHFIGKRQIKLADAKLRSFSGPVFWAGARQYNKMKRIRDKRANLVWASITGFSYNEMEADPDDVKKLNSLLAGLTGRRVEEFEQEGVRIDSLIEQGINNGGSV
jgi:hypothetical protein